MRYVRSTSAFTLVEIMLVIAVIAILMGMVGTPYNYYMDRARTERSLDKLGQEWILAHTEVRNGVLMGDHHANLVVTLEKGKDTVSIYEYTGSIINKQLYKTIMLDSRVEVLGFTGSSELETASTVEYLITPPNGTGAYRIGTATDFTAVSTGIIMRLGYSGSDITQLLNSGRAREVHLRPYFD